MLKRWLAYRLLIESIRRDGFPILPAKAAQEACEMVKVIEGFYRRRCGCGCGCGGPREYR